MTSKFIVLVLLLYFAARVSRAETAWKAKLNQALRETNAVIDQLESRWQINEFPVFLRSVSMSRKSWDLLKVQKFL